MNPNHEEMRKVFQSKEPPKYQGILLLVELNKMFRSGFAARMRPISAIIHFAYNGLNAATATAIVFAGVPGYNLKGEFIATEPVKQVSKRRQVH